MTYKGWYAIKPNQPAKIISPPFIRPYATSKQKA